MTFYLDASLPIAVRTAIAGVRDDVLYAGGPNAPAEGTKDPIWLPIAGREEWIVIMRDKHIRTRPGEKEAFIRAKLRAFCLTNAGNATRWQILELLVARWPRIEQIAGSEPGPYIYSVTASTMRPLAIPQ